VTFWVVRQIADGSNSQLLRVAPAWLVEELYEWVDWYRKSGHFGFVSNLGEVDHSEVSAKVSTCLPPKRALNAPDSLRTEEKHVPMVPATKSSLFMTRPTVRVPSSTAISRVPPRRITS
jgi:hypothetical protein